LPGFKNEQALGTGGSVEGIEGIRGSFVFLLYYESFFFKFAKSWLQLTELIPGANSRVKNAK
jgi:hypothetical protein